MENNEFRKFRIKNRSGYYFDDKIKLEGFDFDNSSINKKSHKNFWFMAIWFWFWFKTFFGAKPLHVRFSKIDDIIGDYDRSRYLVLMVLKNIMTSAIELDIA